MARFFIDRPIFAIVIALFLLLAGTLSLMGLPVAQFPNVSLPSVTVNSAYPGATSEVVQEAVSQVLDTQIKAGLIPDSAPRSVDFYLETKFLDRAQRR